MAKKNKNVLCMVFGHSWQGCKCKRCGETRNEEHSWNGCKCSVCGAVRDEGHNWNGCRCTVCDKRRDEGHIWVGPSRGRFAEEKCCLHCDICYKTIYTEHQFESVEGQCYRKCAKCGLITEPNHEWDGCTCIVCGENRYKHHKWVQDGCNEKCCVCGEKKESGRWHNWVRIGCIEQCSACGAKRENEEWHTWVRNGCMEQCSVCGEQRISHEYHLISHDISYGTGRCYHVDSSDEIYCLMCKTPNACLKYPEIEAFVYKCIRCGDTFKDSCKREAEAKTRNTYNNDLLETKNKQDG